MRLFNTTIKVTKLDVNGVPHETFIEQGTPKPSCADLWRWYMKSLQSQPTRVIDGQSGSINQDKINAYHEQQLSERV